MSAAPASTAWTYQRRVDSLDWDLIVADLNEFGCAATPQLVTAGDAAELASLYHVDEAFRSTVDMGRHRFGRGEYRYFAYPLPEAVDELRHALYHHLLPIARDWYTKLGRPTPWADDLDEGL